MQKKLSRLLALLSALACVLDADCAALRGTHRALAGRLRLRGGAEERCAEPPCDRPEGPVHQLPSCCQRAVAAAQQRAERAERRAAGLQRRLDELEEEFCAAESGRMQARAEAARASEEAERKVRAELEGRLAVLNQRCNEAEAEVQWGNGERTRDLLVIAELKHKIEEHERERADIEDKIRHELAADGRCAAQNAGPTAPEVPLDLWDAADGKGEPSSHGPACWCGAQGGEGGKGPGRRRRRPPPRETKQEKKAFTGRAPAGPALGPKLAKPDLFSPAPTGKPEEAAGAAGAAHAEL